MIDVDVVIRTSSLTIVYKIQHYHVLVYYIYMECMRSKNGICHFENATKLSYVQNKSCMLLIIGSTDV